MSVVWWQGHGKRMTTTMAGGEDADVLRSTFTLDGVAESLLLHSQKDGSKALPFTAQIPPHQPIKV